MIGYIDDEININSSELLSVSLPQFDQAVAENRPDQEQDKQSNDDGGVHYHIDLEVKVLGLYSLIFLTVFGVQDEYASVDEQPDVGESKENRNITLESAVLIVAVSIEDPDDGTFDEKLRCAQDKNYEREGIEGGVGGGVGSHDEGGGKRNDLCEEDGRFPTINFVDGLRIHRIMYLNLGVYLIIKRLPSKIKHGQLRCGDDKGSQGRYWRGVQGAHRIFTLLGVL